MSRQKALLPLVKRAIHFDSLYSNAQRAAQYYGGTQWTDYGEHDPGVTLLEGYSYSTSDLAYRHTLPLADLLTPPVEQQVDGDGIFPAAFGPQQALTCGPITIDDYRRALLDLTDSTGSYYLFSNVQLELLNAQDSSAENAFDYVYYYAPETGTFSFPTSDSNNTDGTRYGLRGNYRLFLQPTRETYSDNTAAQSVLSDFLLNHRNLGEMISDIVWLECDVLKLFVTLVVEDNAHDVAQLYADIYSATENYVTPLVQRNSSVDNATVVYQGPELQHGWIAQLPADVDYTQATSDIVNLSHYPNVLLAIDGVKSLQSLRLEYTVDSSRHFPLPWGKNGNQFKYLLDQVTLITPSGVKLSTTEDAVQACLATEEILENSPVVLPYGKARNTAQYYPVSDKLPPCYGLQQTVDNSNSQSLYQFLLPFEQAMANGCQQLAMLPELLAFRRSGTDVWGSQWPYAAGSMGDKVHADYKAALVNQNQSVAQDYDQELSILNYLLGYFGTQRAARMLDTDADEFLQVEQAYLGQITELAYQRDNIRVDRVSALQKRIAARLGIGANLFTDTVDMSTLPFYLVEHRALLPVLPSADYNSPIVPTAVTLSDDGATMTVTSAATPSLANLASGQLIDFILLGGLQFGDSQEGNYTLQALIVDAVDTAANTFTLQLTENPQLQVYCDSVVSAQSGGNLQWQNCQYWMTEITYPLSYSANTSGGSQAPVTVTINDYFPFPALLRPDAPVVISSLQPIDGSNWSMNAVVQDIDGIAGTLTLVPAEGETQSFPLADDLINYSWRMRYDIDRFSFTASLVLNKAMLPASGDPYTTENWIKQCVQAELPAHVSLTLHWLESDEVPQSFSSFATSYASWQQGNTAPSNATFQLLWKLGIGVLPLIQEGIGNMIIATPEQRTAVVGDSGDEWNVDVIVDDALFFVPKQYEPQA